MHTIMLYIVVGSDEATTQTNPNGSTNEISSEVLKEESFEVKIFTDFHYTIYD